MEPTIRFRCPSCGAAINVRQVYAGRNAACPSCEAPIRVPGSRGWPILLLAALGAVLLAAGVGAGTYLGMRAAKHVEREEWNRTLESGGKALQELFDEIARVKKEHDAKRKREKAQPD